MPVPTYARLLGRAVRSSAVPMSRLLSSLPPDGRAGIDATLVRCLIASQFPQWRDLPVRPVDVDGHDNRTYRLGDAMSVRLPITDQHALAIAKENEWIPKLAPHLPVPIPSILGLGHPGEGYSRPWSVRGWLDGQTAAPDRISDLPHFAQSVAAFLLALQRIDASDGPIAGLHSWYRGASPENYHEEVQQCLAKLEKQPAAMPADLQILRDVWDSALVAKAHRVPVWFHGDVAAGNLLVANGNLAAVIDFGTCGVGDPACDLVIAWTMLSGESRQVFRQVIAQEPETWARARGWALWKSLLLLTDEGVDVASEAYATNVRIVKDVAEDHVLYGK